MRKFVRVEFACILGVLVLTSMTLSAVAQAQMADRSFSRFSVFGGYSLLHYNNGTDTAKWGANELDYTANANGIVASATYNLNRVLGLAGEYGFYHAGSFSNISLLPGESVTANFHTYLFGPKFSLHRGPISPFAQVLMGGIGGTVTAHANGSVTFTRPGGNAFALGIGGGLDWKLTPHLSLRPAQFEYLMSRFPNSQTFAGGSSDGNRFGDQLGAGSTGTQKNLRYSAGVVYNF